MEIRVTDTFLNIFTQYSTAGMPNILIFGNEAIIHNSQLNKKVSNFILVPHLNIFSSRTDFPIAISYLDSKSLSLIHKHWITAYCISTKKCEIFENLSNQQTYNN